jgi:hypothetical protein
VIVIQFLKFARPFGPLLFGIGFVAPLVAQSMDASSVSAPAGLSTLGLGLIVGVSWGLFAMKRGRWI